MDTITPNGFLLPALNRYFPPSSAPAPSEESAALDKHVQLWLQRHVLAPELQSKLSYTVGHGAGFVLAYPTAGQQTLELAADIFAWFVTFADIHVESTTGENFGDLTRQVFSFVDIVNGTAEDASFVGFGSALADVLRRSGRLAPAHQADLRSALHSAMLAWLWEGQLRATDSWPGLGDYITARRHLSASWLERALTEPLGALVLPETVRQDKDFIRMKTAVCNLIGWCNDLFSYVKEERQAGTVPLSLPGLLMREHGCSLTEAFARAGRMCDQEAEQAAVLIQQMETSPVPALRRYARNTAVMLSNLSCWHTVAAQDRYGDRPKPWKINCSGVR